MASCLHCKAKSERYLCSVCCGLLANMLEELPDLLNELDVTRSRQDRLTVGAVGKSDGSTLNAINVGAMSLRRDIDDELASLVDRMTKEQGLKFLPSQSVPTGFIGPLLRGWRRLPRGYSASSAQRCVWLTHHLNALAVRKDAGQFYDAVVSWVGDPDRPNTHRGRIALVLDRKDRTFAGPCPTVKGYDRHGAPVECATSLFALIDQEEVECPRCQQVVNVERNRAAAKTARDLMPEGMLLEMLETLQEPVSRDRLYKWLRQGRLQPRGWIHAGQIVERKIRHRDPRVFSLSQARQLRWQDEAAQEAS
ncbi:hypothetical protein ACEWX3_07530 [Mycobacterium sp. G7A2]|uniref:hypothetical protein n=1 Tax=Mycobacterium sp. G7A2 TaxID=3317307 RepID=UPI0035A83B59